MSDIEKELKHYKEHFKDKVVFCNCDDPQYSNFWKYFLRKFGDFGVKKLISTHYDSSKPTYKLELYNGDIKEIETPLRQNGDFRSEECVELLKEADIVVTNPPFSLFREYVSLLMEHKKKFLIIGSLNSISYKEIFSLLKENKIWVGYNNGYKEYIIPNHYKVNDNGCREENGIKYSGMGNTYWFTNLEIKKRYEDIILYKKYNEKDYPKYDNYDAINVDKIKNIPVDYYEYIGVPITFVDKYNPKQFEIVGCMTTTKISEFNYGYPYINGKKIYARIVIKRRVK